MQGWAWPAGPGCHTASLSEHQVTLTVPSTGRLESVSLHHGEPQAGTEPGQVQTPAVREGLTVQILVITVITRFLL